MKATTASVERRDGVFIAKFACEGSIVEIEMSPTVARDLARDLSPTFGAIDHSSEESERHNAMMSSARTRQR